MATFISNSPDETEAFGRRFAESLKPGDVLALTGGLGSGKTQFVQGLAAGLGSTAEVTSPTFTLIHEYRGPRATLYHIDLYRIDTDRELETLGLDDLLAPNCILLIEWGEKFRRLQREQNVEVTLEQVKEDRAGETERRIQVTTR